MFDNRLQLVINVDSAQASKALTGLNTDLSDLENQAISVSQKWGLGMDRVSANTARAMRANALETMKARQAVEMLAIKVGVTLPEGLKTVIAQSAKLGPIFLNAFSAAVVISMISAVWQLTLNFKELVAKVYDWDGSMQRAKKSAEELNRTLDRQWN